jgi:hypothetical protein
MPVREMLLHLACVVSGLGVCLAGALLFSTGHAAHAVAGGLFFAMGALGVGRRSSGCGAAGVKQGVPPTVPRRRPTTKKLTGGTRVV